MSLGFHAGWPGEYQGGLGEDSFFTTRLVKELGVTLPLWQTNLRHGEQSQTNRETKWFETGGPIPPSITNLRQTEVMKGEGRRLKASEIDMKDLQILLSQAGLLENDPMLRDPFSGISKASGKFNVEKNNFAARPRKSPAAWSRFSLHSRSEWLGLVSLDMTNRQDIIALYSDLFCSDVLCVLYTDVGLCGFAGVGIPLSPAKGDAYPSFGNLYENSNAVFTVYCLRHDCKDMYEEFLDYTVRCAVEASKNRKQINEQTPTIRKIMMRVDTLSKLRVARHGPRGFKPCVAQSATREVSLPHAGAKRSLFGSLRLEHGEYVCRDVESGSNGGVASSATRNVRPKRS